MFDPNGTHKFFNKEILHSLAIEQQEPENVMNRLKGDYCFASIMSKCSNVALLGKFSYTFEIECEQYAPLSIEEIQGFVDKIVNFFREAEFGCYYTLETEKNAIIKVTLEW